MRWRVNAFDFAHLALGEPRTSAPSSHSSDPPQRSAARRRARFAPSPVAGVAYWLLASDVLDRSSATDDEGVAQVAVVAPDLHPPAEAVGGGLARRRQAVGLAAGDRPRPIQPGAALLLPGAEAGRDGDVVRGRPVGAQGAAQTFQIRRRVRRALLRAAHRHIAVAVLVQPRGGQGQPPEAARSRPGQPRPAALGQGSVQHRARLALAQHDHPGQGPGAVGARAGPAHDVQAVERLPARSGTRSPSRRTDRSAARRPASPGCGPRPMARWSAGICPGSSDWPTGWRCAGTATRRARRSGPRPPAGWPPDRPDPAG